MARVTSFARFTSLVASARQLARGGPQIGSDSEPKPDVQCGLGQQRLMERAFPVWMIPRKTLFNGTWSGTIFRYGQAASSSSSSPLSVVLSYGDASTIIINRRFDRTK
ncbi:hypothetical protein M407DRAFT_18097 [Tulasnella calospora MUT 4182]|uniref:Uncharacterized protein n=1 Tax=Tulasnella calospora MUT 4182 TaxID=1051891 RepID=A0A0C3MGV8_9AGAM|nr:hypothetical protein M407DRAFT_18097 [Tulasnella calospora MUT 4182]